MTKETKAKEGTVEVWIAMDQNGGCEAATDEDSAIDRLKDGSSEDLAGTVCRVVKLNITMSEPLAESGSNAAVDVTVKDDAGHNVDIKRAAELTLAPASDATPFGTRGTRLSVGAAGREKTAAILANLRREFLYVVGALNDTAPLAARP